MKLSASLCGIASLFTGFITYQILRKFAALYGMLGVTLPGYARWMLWGEGILPGALLAASAVIVLIGLLTHRKGWQLAGAVSGILLMAGAATIVPAGIMMPLANLLAEDVTPASAAANLPALPPAVDPEKVGTYPSMTGKGGGYFYDDVLEYRVRIATGDGGHYIKHFATFAEARDFARDAPGAERPVALVLQNEWVNEPDPGKFEHNKTLRITEWQVEWLAGGKRGHGSIEAFMSRGQTPGGDASPAQ